MPWLGNLRARPSTSSSSLSTPTPPSDAAQCSLAGEAPEHITDLLDRVPRASSAIENIKSIPHGCFFPRRSIGPAFLHFLRLYLNHRRFRRSDRPERVSKSPRELLPGQTHAHRLELRHPAERTGNPDIPVVLFMENHDIRRSGYHDTEDTRNFDLDDGAGLAAIAIESVAEAALAEAMKRAAAALTDPIRGP